METMLESEAMAILVGAGVSYGRREAALRAAGGALAILEEPEAYAAQLQARGVALVRRAWTDRARMLDELERKGMALVPRGDEYYPPLLRQIAHPPHLLYVYGETDLTDRFPVAVVGTRRASAYGLTHTREIAAELAQTGVCVVSGLALGIDAAAHTGALDAKGRTVAILGSALDQPYPAENRPLMRRILESGGSVVSEYPPGTPPQRGYFLQRNRLIAGLSRGLCVAEARRRSGTMNTVAAALAAGRDVFSVPGSIFSPLCEGTNQLLREGAVPAVSGADILLWYGLAQPEQPEKAKPDGAPLSLDAQRMRDALSAAAPLPLDALCAKTGLPPPKAMAALTELELAGFSRQLAGRQFQLK